jgi:hypothetical protein
MNDVPGVMAVVDHVILFIGFLKIELDTSF